MDQSKNRGASSAEPKPAPEPAPKPTPEPLPADPKRKGPGKGKDEPPVNEADFPRMLHKGDARLTVKTEKELKDAKADGWEFRHKPPVTIDPDAAAEILVRPEHAHVAAMTDVSQLETLRNELVGQPIAAGSRTAEVRAIEARIAQLRASNRVQIPEVPPMLEGVPPAGDAAVKAEIAAATDVYQLKALREQEQAAPMGGRKEVLAAIAARIEEIAS